jgi:hypothetical protein
MLKYKNSKVFKDQFKVKENNYTLNMKHQKEKAKG